MKKILSMILVLAILFSYSAIAEEFGIQVLGGPSTESNPISLDDLQIGQNYTIDGYAKITPMEGKFIDYFARFNKDADYTSVGTTWSSQNDYVYYKAEAVNTSYTEYYKKAGWIDSGVEADYYWFQVDITNLQRKTVEFLKQVSVKVIYDDMDDAPFIGWAVQGNYNYNSAVYRHGASTDGGTFAVLHSSNEEGVDMMYTGHYVFGCTLPNYVIADKAPLRMEINLGGNELTYHIRK